MRRKALSAAFISLLLITALAGTLFIGYAKANFLPPSPPTNFSVTVQSPESKVYTRSNIPVTFTVDISQNWFIYGIYGFTYYMDGQARELLTTYTVSGSSYHCSATLSGLPEGPHSFAITVIAAGDLQYKSVASSKPVSFTINTATPRITVLSPKWGTYNATGLPLSFSVSEQVSWMGYSLDGAAAQTINGNTTLTGLTNGTHTLTVYAEDTVGTAGASKLITFNVETEAQELEEEIPPEETSLKPFPTTLVAIAIVASAAIVSFGLVAYFLRRKGKEE